MWKGFVAFYLLGNADLVCPIQFDFLQFGKALSISNNTKPRHFFSYISHKSEAELYHRYATYQHILNGIIHYWRI